MRWLTARKRMTALAVLVAGAVSAVLWPGSTAKAPPGPPKIDGAWIVLLKGSAAQADATTDALERRGGFKAHHRYGHAVRGFAAHLSDAQAAKLQHDPDVASVTPDRPLEAQAEVDLAAGDSVPAGVRRLGAGARSKVREASTARVAVLDSGVDLSHPDLNAVEGTNCVSPGTPPSDEDGHGTHVAGTIGARNDGRGVVGVAPGTKIYAVKVLDGSGQGSESQVLCGIDWVTATRSDSDPSNDIAVANLSLGGPGDPVTGCDGTADPLHRAICASTRAGVTYVVAAGNDAREFDNSTTPDVPAAYPEVLAVTAMSDSDGTPGGAGGAPACRIDEPDDRYAGFSNFASTAGGAAHTVAGPGVCIRSTWLGGGYATLSGTSMASPHLAGAVALCLGEGGAAGACAGLSPDAIIARVRDQASVRSVQASGSGFAGDPACAVAGRYLGYLGWTGLQGSLAAGEAAVPAGTRCVPPTPARPATPPPPQTATIPPPTPPTAPADRTAPTAALSVPRQRLRRVLARGLRVTLRCSEACTVNAEALLPARTAKRVKLSRGGTARIARRAGLRLSARTRRTVTLRLTRSARRRLARVRRVVLTVSLSARDRAGNRRALRRRVRLRR
jgi:subtilisin